jgi:ribose transport system substrate-binding protein
MHKTRRHRLGFSLVAAVAAVALTACGGGSASSGASAPAKGNDAKVKVTMLFIGYASYTNEYAAAAKAQADKDNVDLTVLDANFKADVQAQQMTTALAQKPDAISVFAVDQQAIVASLAKAAQADIPVTISNTNLAADAVKYTKFYTGPDNYAQGMAQAKMINDALGGKGNIVSIQLNAGLASQVDRTRGLKDGLAQLNSQIKIVAEQPANQDRALAKNLTADFITKYGADLNGIVAQDDVSGVGAAQGVQAAGMSDKIKVIGNGGQADALKAISAGSMYGTFLQSPVKDGQLAIDAAAAAARGQDYPKTTYLPADPITAANVGSLSPEW